ncbi:hypothetical protein MNV49_005683 [Pseudohyphozyma bogoriensis]|nr:hypothetical protein MNV49_005683 [Pseudohyphozyma bogoriensis]
MWLRLALFLSAFIPANAQTHYCPATTLAFSGAFAGQAAVDYCCDAVPYTNIGAAVSCAVTSYVGTSLTWTCTYAQTTQPNGVRFTYWPSSVTSLSISVAGAPGKDAGSFVGGSAASISGTLSTSAYAFPFGSGAQATMKRGAIYVGAFAGGAGNAATGSPGPAGNGGGFSSFGFATVFTAGTADGRIVTAGGGGGASPYAAGGDAGIAGVSGNDGQPVGADAWGAVEPTWEV